MPKKRFCVKQKRGFDLKKEVFKKKRIFVKKEVNLNIGLFYEIDKFII
jgi:hypothetical protein